MRSKAVKVPLNKGEETRRILRKEGILRKDLLPIKKDRFILFPVEREIEGFEIVEDDFRPKRERINSYRDIVNIPDKLKEILPSSYDIVGDIILIKIPDELKPYQREIGEALLKAHKSVKAVYHAEPVKGELRIRDLVHLAGEKRTTTIYREYGIEMEVDVAKVFFSPRLSGERYRIAKLVENGEVIIDMFTGCAPFSLVIAKHANPKIIYAIDINEYAIELARKNVKRNKMLHKIEVIHGDSSKVVRDLAKKGIRADRIIMNLPFGAREFLPDALKASKDGTIIHYYSVLNENQIEEHINHLKDITNNRIDVLKINRIKTYAPREFYICFDISVSRPA